MNTFRYHLFAFYKQVIGVILLCNICVSSSHAFTPTDTLSWQKSLKKYAQRHSNTSQIVNYLNNKKNFVAPVTLPLSSEFTFETEGVQNVRAARINDSVFVMVYDAVPSFNRQVMAGKLTSAGTIVFGTNALITTLASQPSTNLDIARLDDSKFMIVFDDGSESLPQYFAVAGSVSGENITIDAANNKIAVPTADYTSFSLTGLRLTALSSTRGLIVYTQSDATQQGRAIVADVSGLEVSFPQSPATFSSNNTYGISTDALSTTRAVISYNDGGTSIKNIIANIDGVGNITYGTATTIFNSAGAGKTDVAVTNVSAYINIYENNGSQVKAIKNTVSGDVITKGVNDMFVHDGTSINSLSIDKMSTDNAIIMVQDDQAYLFQVSANGSLPVVNYTNSFTANAASPEEATFVVGMTPLKVVGVANTGVSGEGGAYIGDITPPQLMKVFGNGILIADDDNNPDVADGTDFGSITVGDEPLYQTFTIKNEGNATLNLTGAPEVDFSTPGSGYTIVTPPSKTSLGPGEVTTFDVEFAPSSAGTYTNSIIIPTNDPATGMNNWYNFVITGIANPAPPTIEVYGNNSLIFSGVGTTQVEDSTYFGGIPVGDSLDVHFEVRNAGGTALLVSTITSSNPAFEVVQQIAPGKVNPDLSAVLVIRCKPTTEGRLSTTISVPSNDPNLPTFELFLEADGVTTLTTPVLTEVTSTQREVSLTWTDNNTNEFGYAIYRAEPSGPPNPPNPPTPGPFSLIYVTDSNVTNFVDIGRKTNTIYFYQMQAVSLIEGEDSPLSDIATIKTLGNVPVSPSSLNALTLSQTEIQLEWQDNSTNETGFQIYRAQGDTSTNFTLLTTLAANEVFYIDEGLNSKTTYRYLIQATGAEGASPPSDTVNATTLSNAPDSPSELNVITVSGSELKLEWEDESNNELGFVIYRATEQFGGDEKVIDTVSTNITTYLDKGLVNQKKYFYRVQAYNNDGLSANSTNTASGITANVPLIPSNVQFTSLSPTSLEISWQINTPPSTEREADGFTLEAASLLGVQGVGQRRTLPPETFTNGRKTARTTNGLANLIFFPIDSISANSTKYTVKGLIPNQKYLFRLRAYNDKGSSPNTSGLSVVTAIDPNVAIPNAPTSLKVTAVSQSELDLTWQDNSSNELIFKIERRRNGETAWTEIAQVIGGVTSFSSTDLLADSTYFYRVRASNQGGESAYSNIASAKVECNLVVLVTNNSGSNTICSGKASLLVVNTNVTDATFQWKKNGINIPNANLPIFTATETGEYNCQVIAGGCRKSSTTPLVVIVKSSFQVSIRTIDTTTNEMQASVSGAQGYQWYRNYQVIDEATSAKYTPKSDGTYFVIVSNNGCSSTSNLINIRLNTTTATTNDTFANTIKLSPNPASTQTLLTMKNEEYGRYKISILDNKGSLIQELNGIKTSQILKVKLPVQTLAEGIYLLKVRMKKKEAVKKLLKK